MGNWGEAWLDRLARRLAGNESPEPTFDRDDAQDIEAPVTRRSLLRRSSIAGLAALGYFLPGSGAASAANCPGNKRKCDGKCVNVRRSERHCGRCNNKCRSNQHCSKGKCCRKGKTNCNGNCVDLDTSGNHCGRCGHGCTGGDVCKDGECVAPTCNDNRKNNAETDVDCGGPNCPKCSNGKKCASASDCLSGLCSAGVCQACQTDQECSGANVCSGGVCRFCDPGSTQGCYSGPPGSAGTGVCQAGVMICNQQGTAYGPCEGEVTPSDEVCDGQDNDCDGQIDNNPIDENQLCCGDTGPNDECCNSGTTQCEPGGTFSCTGQPCPAGTSCCLDGCVDTDSDVSNCGSCGNACAVNEVCSAGQCVAD